MIKFLFLLPIKLIGLVFIGIGSVIESRQRRAAQAERQRIAEAKAEQAALKEAARRFKAQQAERLKAERAAAAEARRRELAKARQARVAEVERRKERNAAEKVREADNDLAHLEQRQRDLATLYSFAESQYANASTDKQKEAAFRKMMAIDQQQRTAARQAERMQFIINGGGR